MTIDTKTLSFKMVFTVFCAITLTACGGGSSSSGGAPAPVLPSFTLFTTGLYNGDLNLAFEGKNIVDTSDEPTRMVVEVLGVVAGSQQVRIAFAQFSGTSSIGPDGGFSIPTGLFPIRIRGRNNQVISTCRGEFLFDGTFSGNTVSGNVTTLMSFTCDRPDFGPLTATGTFEASQGASKLAGFGRDITVEALNY
ncbi:MAG: hypothetical protein JKX81_02490 [Arenicella sp.]|nr:hypothetical protein [Arenicella sp.]